jgi:predicted phage-related endonuclease
MKVNKFQTEESWLEARNGKITGTKLKDIISLRKMEGKKKGFYQIIAEKVLVPEELFENPIERGKRLEGEAIARFEKETKKKVDNSLVMWVSDENEDMAISPDGIIGKTEAIEVKCINPASHIEAWLTQKIPSEYNFQVLQYFIINEKLKTLYIAFFDPRIPAKDFFYLTVERKDLEEDIEKYKAIEIETLKEINKIVKELTKF